MKNPNDLIGDQTHNLPDCSRGHQPTTLSHISLNGTISTCNQGKPEIAIMSLSRNFWLTPQTFISFV